MRALTGLLALVIAIVIGVMLPAQAFAVDPQATVGGAGSKWFSGTLMMQSGMNCSTAILGSAYSETMVSAIAGYGGKSGVVKVGDQYYASLLMSIPGNPCGSGSTMETTDLILPRGTSVAVSPSTPIRCFGQPRSANTFYEVTNESWSLPPDVGTGSGPYCPASIGASQTGYGVGVGYRVLASGQMFELFVPITSTVPLDGALHSPADEIMWVINSTAAYADPGETSVWTNVVQSGGGGSPYIYFARNPSVVPYWDTTAPTGQENKVEWFANLYSAGHSGTFCWELYSGAPPVGPPQFTCNTNPPVVWSSGVDTSSDLWQVFGTGGSLGPNGGYVPPLFFDPGETDTLRWTFTPSGGSMIHQDVAFTALAGPDSDGDGVPDASDACPTVKGTLGNGCQPGVPPDPDGDGVYGSVDKCPTQNGGGSPDGCPKAAAALTGAIGAIKGNKLARKALAKGVSIPVTCSKDTRVTAALTIAAKVAKKLKIPVKKKAKTVAIGSATGSCSAAQGGKLKLKLKTAFKKKLLKPRKGVASLLTVTFTYTGVAPVTVTRPLKLT